MAEASNKSINMKKKTERMSPEEVRRAIELITDMYYHYSQEYGIKLSDSIIIEKVLQTLERWMK